MTCYVERCCYLISMDLGCTLIGIASFLLSGSMLCVSSWLLFSESHYLTIALHMSDVPIHIIYCIAIIVSACNMVTALLLIVGAYQRRAGFLLAFFGVGIFTTILGQLSALLALLAQHWILALVMIGMSMIYIHFLVVVHTAHDSIQEKRATGNDNPYDELEESLIET